MTPRYEYFCTINILHVVLMISMNIEMIAGFRVLPLPFNIEKYIFVKTYDGNANIIISAAAEHPITDVRSNLPLSNSRETIS